MVLFVTILVATVTNLYDLTISPNICKLTGTMNNYIVRSYRDVIVITKFATRRASKAHNIVIIKTKTILKL